MHVKLKAGIKYTSELNLAHKNFFSQHKAFEWLFFLSHNIPNNEVVP